LKESISFHHLPLQQIIEEGPITVAAPDTVKELEQAARRLAKCVQYVGAATVEYLYSMEIRVNICNTSVPPLDPSKSSATVGCNTS